MLKIGIIGGSGLDNPDILKEAKDLEVTTPYGKPSSNLKSGKIAGVEVVLLARHGRKHNITPTQVNFRANIHALKEAGCTHILATTACGSLREDIKRGDFIILDQFIDFTRHRTITFHEHFSEGNIVHTPMADPFNKELRNVLIKSAQDLSLKYHQQGTVITIEGPRFSTKAESKMFKLWGADIINMSIAPEVILANELNIPYAAIAMSTDYDCWKSDEDPVTWNAILKIFEQNVEKVINLLLYTIPQLNSLNTIKNTLNQEIKMENNKKEDKNNLKFDLKSTIRTIPNWPKKGIMFRDITTLLQNPKAFNYCIEKFKEKYQNKNITKIAGIESRGFIFGAVLAKELNLPFVVIRKPGKLPAETIQEEYQLEYGTDKIEVHRDAISENDNILIIDDLLATGGTAKAASNLIKKLGGNVSGLAFVINLPDLGGIKQLSEYKVFSLVEFTGD